VPSTFDDDTCLDAVNSMCYGQQGIPAQLLVSLQNASKRQAVLKTKPAHSAILILRKAVRNTATAFAVLMPFRVVLDVQAITQVAAHKGVRLQPKWHYNKSTTADPPHAGI
jgi:hypothetical protein